MGKPIKIRNVATGRDDEYAVEVVGADTSRVPLVMATATEVAVTVADQIQQSAAGDLSAKNFLALVYRPA